MTNHTPAHAFANTKIIATVGPACAHRNQLLRLILAGVDLFRLNFAHSEHDWLESIVHDVREISQEIGRPIGLLGDLSGPKIRLGELPDEGVHCQESERYVFLQNPHQPPQHLDDISEPYLCCTYDQLIEDLTPGDRVLLADGLVGMRVIEKSASHEYAICVVEQPGTIRSRQGVNLPGVRLSTPSLTPKDRDDLNWALQHKIDYIGFSFVRSAEDITLLQDAIIQSKSEFMPQIVAKIEKMEAIDDLDNILTATDAVMVARGDLGVEIDIARVPIVQKQIIRQCNQRRIPVITATQMLDSMQTNELPTRAEAGDVANAVLDGTDAVMLSGETAVGWNPIRVVEMMNRIALIAEEQLQPFPLADPHSKLHRKALHVTESVTLAAGTTAEHLPADLIVVITHGGRTAMSMSRQRRSIPILALTDSQDTARRMTLYWGVTPHHMSTFTYQPEGLLEYAVRWGTNHGVLKSGSRIVLVGRTNWADEGHDMMLVHAIPPS